MVNVRMVSQSTDLSGILHYVVEKETLCFPGPRNSWFPIRVQCRPVTRVGGKTSVAEAAPTTTACSRYAINPVSTRDRKTPAAVTTRLRGQAYLDFQRQRRVGKNLGMHVQSTSCGAGQYGRPRNMHLQVAERGSPALPTLRRGQQIASNVLAYDFGGRTVGQPFEQAPIDVGDGSGCITG